MEVPDRLALAGPTERARLIPDRSQTADQVGAVDGTWGRILAALLAAADDADDIGRTVSVDSTVCRAHQHAAGARKRGLRTRLSPKTTRSDVPAAA